MGWVANAKPRPFNPPGNNRYSTYRILGGPQGPIWRGAENLHLPQFDLRTVQPLASRYADGAIQAHEEDRCCS